MKRIKYISFIIVMATLVAGCERDITLDLPHPEEAIVVEGHIEAGQFPYIILMQNAAYFSPVDINTFAGLFVHDAIITLSNGDQTVLMDEICLSTLPANLKPLVYQFLGITQDPPPGQDYCAYVNFSMTGQEGKAYSIRIESSMDTLTATTTIPPHVPIDSIWFEPDAVYGDSLAAVRIQFKDPDTLGNYYRFFSKVNAEPFYPGYFGSVRDDNFANGQIFRGTIPRGVPSGSTINFETYGLFRKGDTAIVKVAVIDADQYEFWRTLEDQKRQNGPFSSPTYVKGNINGGLGVWGGYGSITDTIIINY